MPDSGANPHTNPQESSPAEERTHSGDRFRGSWLRSLPPYLSNLIGISRWHLLAAVILMTLTSLTEGLGVALLFPILQVSGLNMTNQGHVGHFTGEVQHLLRHSGLRPSLWLATLLMIFMLLMALRSLFNRAQSVGALGAVLRYEMALSRRLYQAIINAEWLFLVRSRSSEFTHALTGEMARVSTATYLFIGVLSNTILALVYIALALKLSTETTLMVLAAGAALLLVSRGWTRAVHESGTAISESMSAVYTAATERIQNLKTIKTYDAQSADLAMFTDLEASAVKQSLRNILYQAASTFWFEAGSLAVLAAVIFVSLRVFRVGAASILLLLAIFTRLMPRLASGNSQFQAFLTDLPAFERIMGIYRKCIEYAEVPGRSGSDLSLTRELRLDSVSFQYGPDLAPVLNGLSLSITAGSMTGIAGPSGSGKSTVADLINGLLLPGSGHVLIDGVPLTPSMTRAWRRRIGYVAQDTVLFHDTIRANLLWAEPGASEAALREALNLAAAEFAFELPAGLDTTVGDRGVLLSNGERQRIALARALLRKPSLLILDEATNSLDVENEKRILDAIERIKGHTTILLIAHQNSALQRCDPIYVLEKGCLAESGTWSRVGSYFSSAGSRVGLDRL